MNHAELDACVKDWLRLDQNPTTREEVQTLAAAQNYTELSKIFSARISFGTAGLRAEMRAGTAYLNELVIIQSTQGLVRYALTQVAGAKEKGIVIGYDHRFQSKRFASLSAGVARREGMKVYLYDGLVHTPMVPFAVKRLGAAVGIMITASHNPAKDNGYKVYYSNACQIIPPHDHGIAASIDNALEVDPVAFEVYRDESTEKWNGTEAMKAEYIKSAELLCIDYSANSKSKLNFTYTAMHGVGLPFAQAVFDTFGFPPFNPVPSQAQPDPTFPTVKFPNPEEKGALDLALLYADSIGSTIVLANDPDADRFTAAEKADDGTWKSFTGDQLGVILGFAAYERYRESGKPINKLAMAASTVSSKMLAEIGRVEGFLVVETLTGFKYLGNEALRLVADGYEVPFAYEEAIGYMNGNEIRDKDGVTTLAIFAQLATKLDVEKKTISSFLESLYDKYGFFTTSNSYFICRDPKITNQIFHQLRYGAESSTVALPKSLAGLPITYIRDLTIGYDSSNPPSFTPDLPVDPTTHMISFAVESINSEPRKNVKITGTLRTSGTEPKIKFYLEGSGHDRVEVVKKLALVREAIGVDWLQAKAFGLESA